MFTGLKDSTEQLLFQLSFYESFVASLSLKFGQIEKKCYRAGNQSCISMHDSIRQQEAAIERLKHQTARDLAAHCQFHAVLPLSEGNLGQWLLDTPLCARPHIEKYVELTKSEAKILSEAHEKFLDLTY